MTDEFDQQTARLFFALWPEGHTRGALAQAADKLHRRCGGKVTRAQTIHLTLVFLGNVPVARIGELVSAMEGLSVPAFALEMNRLGWWTHNRIAWAGPTEQPDELGVLVGQLRDRLAAGEFAFDTKKFVPHVTLLRKANCAEEAFFPLDIQWRAKEFVLVRSAMSAAGAAYETIGRWKLQM